MLIEQIQELQARRKFYISCANKQTNAAGALVRRALGWRVGDDEAVSARAARIVAAALADKPQKDEDAEIGAALAFDLSVIAAGLAHYAAARHQIELEMQRAVRKLPIAAWAKAVRGLGELGLAVIIGEAGDLARYSNPGKLWKRLGLAPHDGKAYSTWRREGGLSAEDWTAAGYAPRRRAEIYACIGDPLFRAQAQAADKETGEIIREAGPYRVAYDRRRLRTADTHPDWTKLHSHNDALRIMTKELILDLWSEWRRAVEQVTSIYRVPVADTLPAAPDDRRGLRTGVSQRTTAPAVALHEARP